MASRYWVGGSATWDNTAGTKWSATSGGAGGASAPTAADDVFFDANSGSGTVTTASTATCLSANFTGFTGTFNAATSWTVSLSLTFSAGMNITGNGGISKTGNGGTWTFNGKTYTGGWTLPTGGGFSTTIGDDLVFVGNISGGPSGNTVTAATPRTITVGGNLIGGAVMSLNNISFVMNGSGSISGTFARTGGTPTITINTSGTINHNSTLSLSGIVFTYVTAGTWNSTSTISFAGTVANTVNNVSSITFSAMSFGTNNGQSVTLNSDMYVTGNLSNSTTNSFINGPGKLYVRGNITPTQPIGGTSTIEMESGSNSNISSGTILNNLIINKSGGATVTLTGNLVWGANGNQFTLTAGIINPGSTTVTISTNASVTLNNLTLWNLTIPGLSTITQNSTNTILNNLTLASVNNVSFAGTSGWTCANLICLTAGRTITLQNSIQYITTSNSNFLGADLSRITMTSNDSSIKSIWTLEYGASQSMIYVNGTRIDSSQGQTIWSFKGVLNDTINWSIGSRPGQRSSVWVK